jgi:hypothetical protein
MQAAAVRVIHRHQIGTREFTRVSELSYVGRRPVVVLSWLHDEGKVMPGICVELDPAKLRKGPGRRVLRYDGITVDPRYSES